MSTRILSQIQDNFAITPRVVDSPNELSRLATPSSSVTTMNRRTALLATLSLFPTANAMCQETASQPSPVQSPAKSTEDFFKDRHARLERNEYHYRKIVEKAGTRFASRVFDAAKKEGETRAVNTVNKSGREPSPKEFREEYNKAFEPEFERAYEELLNLIDTYGEQRTDDRPYLPRLTDREMDQVLENASVHFPYALMQDRMIQIASLLSGDVVRRDETDTANNLKRYLLDSQLTSSQKMERFRADLFEWEKVVKTRDEKQALVKEQIAICTSHIGQVTKRSNELLGAFHEVCSAAIESPWATKEEKVTFIGNHKVEGERWKAALDDALRQATSAGILLKNDITISDDLASLHSTLLTLTHTREELERLFVSTTTETSGREYQCTFDEATEKLQALREAAYKDLSLTPPELPECAKRNSHPMNEWDIPNDEIQTGYGVMSHKGFQIALGEYNRTLSWSCSARLRPPPTIYGRPIYEPPSRGEIRKRVEEKSCALKQAYDLIYKDRQHQWNLNGWGVVPDVMKKPSYQLESGPGIGSFMVSGVDYPPIPERP